MLSKTHRINLRVTEEIYDRICGVEGETFTEKFERLIYEYWLQMPELEAKRDRLQKTISEYQAELSGMKTQLQKASKINDILQICLRDLDYRVL